MSIDNLTKKETDSMFTLSMFLDFKCFDFEIVDYNKKDKTWIVKENKYSVLPNYMLWYFLECGYFVGKHENKILLREDKLNYSCVIKEYGKDN